MKNLIFFSLSLVFLSSPSFSAPINIFMATQGLDDRGLIRQCNEAKKQATASAMLECRGAGYEQCELREAVKLGYWKNGFFDLGFCKYQVVVRGTDNLKRDARLFKFSGFSQFGKCENNRGLADFVESNVLAECKLKYRQCESVYTKVLREDVYGCVMESIARGLD